MSDLHLKFIMSTGFVRHNVLNPVSHQIHHLLLKVGIQANQYRRFYGKAEHNN